MKKETYLEVFDSRNTATVKDLHHASHPLLVLDAARKESRIEGVYKVSAYRNGAWNQYEKGVMTEWSYPEGIL